MDHMRFSSHVCYCTTTPCCEPVFAVSCDGQATVGDHDRRVLQLRQPDAGTNAQFCYHQRFDLAQSYFFATTVFCFAGTRTIFCYQQHFGFVGINAKILQFATTGVLVCWNQQHFCYNRHFLLCWKNAQFCIFATNVILICWSHLQLLLPPVFRFLL
ncbi:hypothetical protein VPH35_014257 [Triticum aestivum]